MDRWHRARARRREYASQEELREWVAWVVAELDRAPLRAPGSCERVEVLPGGTGGPPSEAPKG